MLPISYEKKRRRIDGYVVLLIIVFALLSFRLWFNAAYTKVYVVGSSMAFTLDGGWEDASGEVHPGGDYVYVFKTDKIERGDIVTVWATDAHSGESKQIIKRVIAKGGDRVEIKNSVLYLNGKVLEEPYVSPSHNAIIKNYGPIVVPAGHYFVLGDNRDNSNDSRYYGTFDESDILGVVAEWSLRNKSLTRAVNTFFEFTLPSFFGA